ncbi:unnamed protein product [Cuscuta europaea]|uniref:Morc S5 domain-containing protein n=1 Tax=Cuscuta europaea TaxID=41803 RepID=A0A9P1A0L6_CUSEU|nr:unnamed protein product [Cuscuta europaea]
MEPVVKEETMEVHPEEAPIMPEITSHAICISTGRGDLPSENRSNGFNDGDDSEDQDGPPDSPLRKKRKSVESALPLGFLDPLPPEERSRLNSQLLALPPSSTPQLIRAADSGNKLLPMPAKSMEVAPFPLSQSCRQFWKAGDYEGPAPETPPSDSGGFMDHVRVHPKFLHSNATSHKWALGAFAELLDNALDEVCNGATYVSVDVLNSNKDHSRMILVEDNGGGMTLDKMRQCMSLGYSAKSKMANTIGQYGNGFKTSSMRLGADVIVFSRCQGKDGKSPTQCIGMLSYSFLRGTRKEDIVVPMIGFEKREDSWEMMPRSSASDWKKNLDTIVQWSPYISEAHLLQQFDFLKDQGTRIVIYNLWEDDEGSPELDFDTDIHDIQIRGVNRDEKKIVMAKTYPDSKHFLTYQHSLRSYASILYLRLPEGFRIILRGEDVQHHNIIDDMVQSKEITYRPQCIASDHAPKGPNMYAVVSIGFSKDAKHHIDMQGFNVYHKNRLIKPFWRVWNAAGSDGRGVIGVLEANFIEPAHDKQGFERTVVLARLETRLQAIQKDYWLTNCHLIGYAKRRNKKNNPDLLRIKSSSTLDSNGHYYHHQSNFRSNGQHELFAHPTYEDNEVVVYPNETQNPFQGPISKQNQQLFIPNMKPVRMAGCLPLSVRSATGDVQEIQCTHSILTQKMREENLELKRSLEAALTDLQFERDRNMILESKIHTAGRVTEFIDQDHETLYKYTEGEIARRDVEEERLRKRLRDASETIQELLDKVKMLESKSVVCIKSETTH